MGQVTRIQRHGQASHRRTIFVDGEPWRSLPAELLRELGLAEGDAIDVRDVDERLATLEDESAWQRSLRLLRYRARCSSELAGRLRDDGYAEPVVCAVVERLLSSGILDDKRYAEAFARTLVESRGLGRVRAQREMTGRGIPDEVTREALDALAPPESEGERAREAARRLRRAGDTPERLAARLFRRGFALGDSLGAAREITEKDAPSTLEDTF